jgi:hypothetical protein
MNYLWLSFGICIFLLIFIINNIFSNLNPFIENYKQLSGGRVDWTQFSFAEFVSPLFLLLYGFPTFITGVTCRFKPMMWGGIFCWVCCIISIYTTIRIDLALTALSAIFAWLIPGIIMKQDYRKAKLELGKTNV